MRAELKRHDQLIQNAGAEVTVDVGEVIGFEEEIACRGGGGGEGGSPGKEVIRGLEREWYVSGDFEADAKFASFMVDCELLEGEGLRGFDNILDGNSDGGVLAVGVSIPNPIGEEIDAEVARLRDVSPIGSRAEDASVRGPLHNYTLKE